MIKISATLAVAMLSFAQPLSANIPALNEDQFEAQMMGEPDTQSCNTGESFSDAMCVIFVGVGIVATWVVKEGYPDFERNVFRPMRDEIIEISKKTPKEIERILEDLGKTPEEIHRVIGDIGKETVRMAEDITEETSRALKDAEKGISEATGKTRKEIKRFLKHFKL